MGPPIKDTLKEDKPLNKGQSKKYTLIQPPKEDNLFSKGQEDGFQVCPLFGGCTTMFCLFLFE